MQRYAGISPIMLLIFTVGTHGVQHRAGNHYRFREVRSQLHVSCLSDQAMDGLCIRGAALVRLRLPLAWCCPQHRRALRKRPNGLVLALESICVHLPRFISSAAGACL
jgi:hypothetical protein